jgi:hypothetical protein
MKPLFTSNFKSSVYPATELESSHSVRDWLSILRTPYTTGYPSWGHPTQLVIHPEDNVHNWLSILRTPYTTQNIQRKRKNKWLHTPRTTDRMHTRQDKWIQKELAFTPAKNVTKPNPFKIILLQHTRKENNWETEETLERAIYLWRQNGPNGPTLDVCDGDDFCLSV